MTIPPDSIDVDQVHRDDTSDGSPFAPHDDSEVEEMLAAVGVDTAEELFDIPESVRFEGSFDIDGASEQRVRQRLRETVEQNEDYTEFLGRGHNSHYVPSIVDRISLRSEFLTSYTQYQPEITQGFLQVLFEYQSVIAELTGLDVANCSMYDAATALGEAATLADRSRRADGNRVLVPDYMRDTHRDVLENYVEGTELVVEAFDTENGQVNPETLENELSEDVVLIYVENPTIEGVIEENLTEIGELSDAYGALYCIGSDPVALSLLQSPGSVGADMVVGDASVLGLSTAYGMGLGMFACDEEFLRQVPGRLVGASEDSDGTRAFTLTLQTREQHIRRERATSNICTNQAWVALRTAIHAASLGPSGLVSLAEKCHRLPERVAAELDEIDGVSAPVRDCHHFREFKARVEPDARELAADLREEGIAIHALGSDEIQVSITDVNEHRTDDFVQAITEVMN
ncbi:Glycine dehydrogenase (decarboxylating) (plasmid) [Haloterrigena turkmenica DSM 5511]|uniref:glycine dehydrogenase (aminomethyl-transferring) n=1 Tax=Haloterrigena turkmenica (strain ATCC 51198 / DSM 5511 / JCM 9101 / NCIMB 13204 / VKM B-1734 / 4k) TaxID=543526 RepID=D2S0S0_HALTV|nr:Glycine dehydrogenase (decarboxylating) [Haloterrigena turkmenica DSM 5511]